MALVDPEENTQRFKRLSSAREIVFGIQDGVLTTAGVLCGLSGAATGRSQIILAALASTAAGALSMGAGAYLGAEAETELLSAEIERRRRAARREPYVLQEELLEELAKEGLSREASYRVVSLLSSSPRVLVSVAESKLYGVANLLLANPVTDGLVMGFAFLAGALVPLLPYILVTGRAAGLATALSTTAVALFAVGYFQGWLAEKGQRWLSGLRFLMIAMGAAAAGYLIGLAISPIGAAY